MERVKASRKQVKQLLADAGMTQKDICRLISISCAHFCRCLNDGSLTRKVADKVCAILDCSVDDLGRYSAVKGMTSCRPPESEISNEKSNLSENSLKESENSLKTCDGCKHNGMWENEFWNGYNCPCTRCIRRMGDNYER